jgi:SOS-response transcriptional repressor LexA
MEKHKKQIMAFYHRQRRMPSYAEMMPLFGFRSKNAVFKLVHKLEEDGFLSKDTTGRLIPNKLYGEVRVLGQVEAGFPSPAEEELCDTMSLDEFLIKNKEATYMLKISGGDMVLVDRSQAPATDDIVIAEVDGKWTIKYLRKKGSKVYLEPANKKFPLIYPEEELKIAAVVKAVIRKY